jgi:hypothetical protein
MKRGLDMRIRCEPQAAVGRSHHLALETGCNRSHSAEDGAVAVRDLVLQDVPLAELVAVPRYETAAMALHATNVTKNRCYLTVPF